MKPGRRRGSRNTMEIVQNQMNGKAPSSLDGASIDLRIVFLARRLLAG
jgi:hypothetical protein